MFVRLLQQRGFTLIEVLVTFLIIAVGLLGLAALQQQTTLAQLESYQAAQALNLVEDMSSRIRLNPSAAINDAYTPGATYGQDSLCTVSDANTQAANDLCAWGQSIAGSTVRTADDDPDGAGVNVGAPINAAGCISAKDTSGDGVKFIVALQWQGVTKSAEVTFTCNGQTQTAADALFGGEGYRRVLFREVVLRG